MESNSPWIYTRLKPDEIRLVQVLPGEYKDDISLQLRHRPFKPASSANNLDKEASKATVQSSLPAGWFAHRTPEGTWFFTHTDGSRSYRHPLGLVIDEASAESDLDEPPLDTDTAEPGFEALSYVWGNSAKTHVAYITSAEPGNNSRLRVQITSNLDSVLRHLRFTDRTRTLWIDAFCIDQDNDEERSTQVMHMGELYEMASRVIVWLGVQSDDSSLALETLEHLGDQIEVSDDNWVFRSPTATEPADWCDRTCYLPYNDAQWKALEHLFARPWFHRLWVIQEIVRAKPSDAVLCCGYDQLEYRRFVRAQVGLSGRAGVPVKLSERIGNTTVHTAYSSGFNDMFIMMDAARMHGCGVPHDKIFSLLSLFGPKLRQKIKVSYRIPYETVYQQLFLAYIEVSGRLDLLGFCYPRHDNFLGPSWVMDWRSYKGSGDQWFIIEPTNQAAGISRADTQFLENTNTLEILGTVRGSVVSLFPYMEGEDVAGKIQEMLPSDLLFAEYPSGQSNLEALAQLLCLGKTRQSVPSRVRAHDWEQWKDIISNLIHHKTGNDMSQNEWLREKAGHTYSFWEHGRFFSTSEGYLGFGPVLMQPSDIIVVLLGLHTPLVVRKRGDGRVRVIGACHVQGLMNGESLLGNIPQGWFIQQRTSMGRYRPVFINLETGLSQFDDPRLGPIPEPWQRVGFETTADTPFHVDFFKNTETGEVINYDPRMSAEALRACGLELKVIRLA